MNGSSDGATYSRVTERYLTLGTEAEGLRLPRPSHTLFRPTSLVEILREGFTWGCGYRVTVHGPVLTPKGRDHATQIGSLTWISADLHPDYQGESPFPDALRALLLGPDALQAMVIPQ